MQAGTLRDRITIQSATFVQDDEGGRTALTWSTFATVSAEVEPLSEQKQSFADGDISLVTHRITIRYLSGLTTKHRVVLPEGTPLAITQVLDPDRRRRSLVLLCTGVEL
jgi:SPP1 family predicted phage head-tail adaptor